MSDDPEILQQGSHEGEPLKSAKANGDESSMLSTSPPPASQIVRNTTFFLDSLTKLVGLLTWPVVLLIAAIVFHEPLKRIIDIVPKKIEQSNELMFAGLTVKIQEKARALGNEELARTISGLSPLAVEWLLKIGDGSHRVVGTRTELDQKTKKYTLPSSLSVWRELEGRGLLAAEQSLESIEAHFHTLSSGNDRIPMQSVAPEDERKLLSYSVSLTANGKRAYKIILEVVSELVASKATESTK